ncbi:MAG: BON domain-containing protein [Gammaproteobacteria bacterium]|nr:BON domain-containing protein [Gammaproteobacteria bacterium]
MKFTNTIHTILLITILATTVSGCAGLAVGGAATGIAVIHDRRSSGTVIDDQGTNWKVSEAIFKDKELSDPSHINVTVYNNVVLLTGETPSEDLKLRANALAAQSSGNKKIYNELAIASPTSLTTRTNDTYITAKVKTVLLEIDNIPTFDPTRVKVVTEDSVVYLMGLVTTQESNAVTEKARNVSGVKKVVRLFEYLTP